MTVDDLMYFFRTENLAKIGRLVGVSKITMYTWKKTGRIPYLRQLHIQRVTNGALTAGDSDGNADI